MLKTIYHYCSCKTFMSIISNCTLRMTNIQKSNDYMEVINSMDVFERALIISCNKFAARHPEDYVFSRFKKDISIHELVENAVNNNSLTYYAVCFSEEKDLLSQWRGYADDASGVAIGFDIQYLHPATDYKNMKYMKVEYDADGVIWDLVEYITKKLEMAQKAMEQAKSIIPSYYENAISAVISSFIYNAVFYKNKAFSEEKEWRLVFYPFGNMKNLLIRHKVKDMAANGLYYDRMSEFLQREGECGPFIRKPISFGLRRNNIFTYFDLDFSSIAPIFVKEIVLGPKNRMDDLELRMFLLSHGFDPSNIQISHSLATYQ